MIMKTIDRREFLRAGVLGSGVIAAGGTLVAGSDADETERPIRAPSAASAFPERVAGARFTLSCAGYSFRSLLPGRNPDPKMSLEDFIDFCAQQELDGVELTSYFFPRTDDDYLASLKRRAFVNGLAVTGTPVGNNFCHPPGAERDGQLRHVREWTDRAALLGAPCVRVFGGSAPRGVSVDQATAWCVDSLKQACKHAGKRGVVLAIENHGGITATAEQVIGLVRTVDSPWLGINLDTGNFHERDPYEEIERAAPHAVVVQLKVEVGRGSSKRPADVERILGILRRSGFRGVIALEYEASEDPLTAVPRHLAELRRLVR